jgi:iron transport multicopper oxidase
MINNVTYLPPKVPTLYTALSAPSKFVNTPTIYGAHTNPYVLKYGDVIEIVLINKDDGSHPWHLHGHAFQVIARSKANTPYDSKTIQAPQTPMRRDTIQVHAGGYVVLRFKANNPGVFLFHCHIEWHMEAGLVATLIEAPDRIAREQSIPRDHAKVCRSQNILTKGNAAGNSNDWLNLTGESTTFEHNPWG